jgi:hypothetical protein
MPVLQTDTFLSICTGILPEAGSGFTAYLAIVVFSQYLLAI